MWGGRPQSLPFCAWLSSRLHLILGPGLQVTVQDLSTLPPPAVLVIKRLALNLTVNHCLQLKGSSERMTLFSLLGRTQWMSVSISCRFMALSLVSCYLVSPLNLLLSNEGRIASELLKVSSLLKSTQHNKTSS